MNDDPRLFDAFDECVTRLATGESAQACLERFPDLREELGPLLAAVQAAQAAGRAPHHAQLRSRARLLAEAAERRPQTRQGGVLIGWARRLVSTAIALAAGFMLGTTGLYYASASTLPGDTLYGLKRAFESARIQLSSDPGQRLTLEESYNERRATELQAVLAEDRPVTVTFGGVLTGRTPSAWQIGGFNVQVTPQTEIAGEPQPGFYVSVTAENQGGTLIALRLAAEEMEVIGVLGRSGAQWVINGTTFTVGPSTMVAGNLAPGVTAAARIRTLHTGERVAVSLITLAPTATPTRTSVPSPTPPPSATPTPSATRPPTRPPTLAPTLPPPTSPATLAAAQPPTQQAAATPDDDRDADDDDGDDHSGSGGGNSGPGGGGGDDDDDGNSGPGGGDDDDDDDSGSGGGDDDDD